MSIPLSLFSFLNTILSLSLSLSLSLTRWIFFLFLLSLIFLHQSSFLLLPLSLPENSINKPKNFTSTQTHVNLIPFGLDLAMAARQMWRQQQQGRSSGKFDWFSLGFSCGFLLDFSYGFSVGFSFYWFWFGFGMGFRQVWVVVVIVGLCWVGGWKIAFYFFFAKLLWSLGKRGNPNKVKSQTREKKREREREVEREKIIKY